MIYRYLKPIKFQVKCTSTAIKSCLQKYAELLDASSRRQHAEPDFCMWVTRLMRK